MEEKIIKAIIDGKKIIINRVGEDCKDPITLKEFESMVDSLEKVKESDKKIVFREDADYYIVVNIA